MLGKMLKGGAWCATIGLSAVGALTFVPDDAWKSFPEPLSPARAMLAEIGVAPDVYRNDAEKGEDVAVGADSAPENDANVRGFSAQNADFNDGARTAVRIGRRNAARDDAFSQTPGAARNGFRDAALSNAAAPEFSPDSNAVSAVSDERAGRDGRADRFERAESADDSDRNVSWNGVGRNDSTDAARTEPNGAPAAASSEFSLDAFPDVDANVPSAPPVAPGAYSDATEIPPFEDVAETPIASDFNENTSNPANPANSAAVVAASPTETPSFVPETGAKSFVDEADFELENAIQEAAALEKDAPTDASESARRTKDVFLTLNRIRRERGATLSPEKTARLDGALDRLAFDVFYNPARAVLEPLYVVAQGDTPASVAAKFSVTPETLAAINGLDFAADAPLPIGATLKTVRGPVVAELSASKRELLLTFDGLYAGRFAFGAPEKLTTLRGQFVITGKIVNPSCNAVDAAGNPSTIPGGAPENPLGAAWIALDGGVGLQGTNRPELVGTLVSENGGFIFNNREILQLNVLLPVGATVVFGD